METHRLIVDDHPIEHNQKGSIKQKIQAFLFHSRCCGNLIPVRYEIAIVTSLGFLISFALRCNMGVSVVVMTRNRTILSSNGTVKYVEVIN